MKTFKLLLLSAALFLSSGFANAGHWVVPTPSQISSVGYGSIVIDYENANLFLVLGEQSILYRVAVPMPGKQWKFGEWTTIEAKYENPDWAPPAVVKAAHPELANLYTGGSAGNPMGTRAMTLGLNEIAIHGTTEKMRASIGKKASFGCIRMRNEDIEDLFNRVEPGTHVTMLSSVRLDRKGQPAMVSRQEQQLNPAPSNDWARSFFGLFDDSADTQSTR